MPVTGLFRDGPSYLHKGLSGPLAAGQHFSDVTIQTPSGQLVACHQVVLAACSPRFASILTNGDYTHKTLPLAGADSSALTTLLQFMYTGECPLSEDGVVMLHDAAAKLAVQCIVRACEAFMSDVASKDVAKLVDFLNHATATDSTATISSVLKLMESRLSDVVSHPSFQQLSEQGMQHFLRFQQGHNKPVQQQLDAANAWSASNPSKLMLAQHMLSAAGTPPAATAAAAAATSPSPAADALAAGASMPQMVPPTTPVAAAFPPVQAVVVPPTPVMEAAEHRASGGDVGSDSVTVMNIPASEVSGMHHPSGVARGTGAMKPPQGQMVVVQTTAGGAGQFMQLPPFFNLKPGCQVLVVEPLHGYGVPPDALANPNEAMSAPARISPCHLPVMSNPPAAQAYHVLSHDSGEATNAPGPSYPMYGIPATSSKAKGDKIKPVCCIDNCFADLSNLREYHQRFRVCDFHLKAPSVMKDGIQQRFCQQCGRFHVLSEFDGTRRSCRAQLERHNARRRKRGELYEEVAVEAPSAGDAVPSATQRPTLDNYSAQKATLGNAASEQAPKKAKTVEHPQA